MQYKGYLVDLITNGYFLRGNGKRILIEGNFPYEGDTLQEKAEAHVDALVAEDAREAQEIIAVEQLQQTISELQQVVIDQQEVIEQLLLDKLLRGDA